MQTIDELPPEQCQRPTLNGLLRVLHKGNVQNLDVQLSVFFVIFVLFLTYSFDNRGDPAANQLYQDNMIQQVCTSG